MGTVTAALGMDTRRSMFTVREAGAGHLMINEVDYDQVGTDNAEFVELYNGAAVPVDLAGLAVVFLNGSSGAEYLRVALTGAVPPGGFAVVANAMVTVPMGLPRFNIGNDAIQNGAPDGVALVDTRALTVIDAFSYEGPIRMATIMGFPGAVDLVEGMALAASVADSNTAPGSLSRIPSGTDTDDAAMDWRLVSRPTPGTPNAP
jgi:hypothetical protein